MPRPQKLLPKPCPICEKKNGTVQITIWNPRFHPFYSDGYHYHRKTSDVIIRIGHYIPLANRIGKGKGKSKNKNKNKQWCSFRVRNGLSMGGIALEKIFQHPGYRARKGLTLRFSPSLFESVKRYGWSMRESKRVRKGTPIQG